jgi:hypothetical protein
MQGDAGAEQCVLPRSRAVGKGEQGERLLHAHQLLMSAGQELFISAVCMHMCLLAAVISQEHGAFAVMAVYMSAFGAVATFFIKSAERD